MATSVTTSLPQWLAGCTYDANGGNDLRNSGVTPYFYNPGASGAGSTISVLGGVVGGSGLSVSPNTGMTINVKQGSFVVPNTTTPTAGGYASALASTATLTVQTADPSNPRIDIVVANVVDAGNSSSFGEVQIITGTAAPSPSVPSAPGNSITLAQISVPAGTSTITSGLITDKRTFTVTAGGVLPAAKSSVTGYNGQLAYDSASGSFYHNAASGSGGSQRMRTLPWAPVTAYRTTDCASVNNGQVTAATVNVTTDGSTDIAIYLKATGIYMSASHGEFGLNIQAYIDGTLIDEMVLFNTASDGVVRGGGSFTAYTDASQGTTPSAGTHAITYRIQGIDSPSTNVTLRCASYSPAVLRVAPVYL